MENAKTQLYLYVDKIRKNLNLQSDPVNALEVCNKIENINLTSYPFKTNGLCASALVGEKVDQIILNSNRNSKEQNFDCSHELIHLRKHWTKQNGIFKCFDSQKQNSFYEWEANEGSAEFLVSYNDFLPLLKDNYLFLNTYSSIEQFKVWLSDYFSVSYVTIHYRIDNLKYEFEQYLRGTPLDKIKFLSNTELKNNKLVIQSLNDKQKSLKREHGFSVYVNYNKTGELAFDSIII